MPVQWQAKLSPWCFCQGLLKSRVAVTAVSEMTLDNKKHRSVVCEQMFTLPLGGAEECPIKHRMPGSSCTWANVVMLDILLNKSPTCLSSNLCYGLYQYPNAGIATDRRQQPL